MSYNNEDIVKDKSNPLDNIDLIRKFHGSEDERGFILIHVAIDSKTNQ